jgi:LysR family transcriptional regulator, glycine cleavage system transcriptional activator
VTLQLSLAALRAVEAAARLRSYTLAAQELHITHSAVSHQVRQVESQLGTTLFTRVRTQMVPTPACEQLVGRLRSALGEIDAALRQTAAHDKTETAPLYLSVMADFANVWLVRRIGDYYPAVSEQNVGAKHPHRAGAAQPERVRHWHLASPGRH